MNETLRTTLQWLHYYGDDITLRIGPTGKYGQPDTETTADTLLTTLEPSELDRLAILTWNYQELGYIYGADDALGWIHLYETPNHLEPGPVLLVMRNEATENEKESNTPCQNS